MIVRRGILVGAVRVGIVAPLGWPGRSGRCRPTESALAAAPPDARSGRAGAGLPGRAAAGRPPGAPAVGGGRVAGPAGLRRRADGGRGRAGARGGRPAAAGGAVAVRHHPGRDQRPRAGAAVRRARRLPLAVRRGDNERPQPERFPGAARGRAGRPDDPGAGPLAPRGPDRLRPCGPGRGAGARQRGGGLLPSPGDPGALARGGPGPAGGVARGEPPARRRAAPRPPGTGGAGARGAGAGGAGGGRPGGAARRPRRQARRQAGAGAGVGDRCRGAGDEAGRRGRPPRRQRARWRPTPPSRSSWGSRCPPAGATWRWPRP